MKIRAEHLSHHFRVRPVLRDVSFAIPEGELVAIMGPNGMGKSTVLKTLAGALTPIRGSVSINGVKRGNSCEEERRIRQQIAYLPDHPWVPTTRTGREFLFAMGENYGVSRDRLFDHMERLLHLFQLTEKADSNIGGYSNGQKKKIALAATLITDAPILLLDEPFTGGLDPSGIHALKQVLLHLAERSDVTVVLASQIPEIAEAIASRVLVMKDGKLIAEGSPLELIQKSGSDTDHLGDALEILIDPNTAMRVERYFE